MIRALLITCMGVSIALAASSFWIDAKAALGQVLLERAWDETLVDSSTHKAWPWADTWPVAKLTVPKLNKSLIVLEGVSGEAMAFGPGRIAGIVAQGEASVTAIGGHRDSHLQFVEHMIPGDTLILQTDEGDAIEYYVTRSFVAHSHSHELLVSTNENALILITCFPFNALQTGGPLRYVLVAEPKETSA